MPRKNKPDEHNRPFEKLRGLLKQKNLPLTSDRPQKTAPPSAAAVDPEEETRLFAEAMDGVVPLEPDERRRRSPGLPPSPAPPANRADRKAIDHLHRLVDTGEGFTVADTPEYREGVGLHVPKGITRHLHQGQFSIQDHIDLHGLSASQAGEALHIFFKETAAAGKRAVLVIHGRGLSSPDKPVLKAMVHRWLDTGPWRHWVMAYSSARACDGGAGATYVLLRRRPLTRRLRKGKKRGR